MGYADSRYEGHRWKTFVSALTREDTATCGKLPVSHSGGLIGEIKTPETRRTDDLRNKQRRLDDERRHQFLNRPTARAV